MELNELVATYRENGFVVAKKAFDLGSLDSFIDELNQVIFQYDPTEVDNEISRTSLDIYYEADGKTVKKCERILYNIPNFGVCIERRMNLIGLSLRKFGKSLNLS